jgi:S-adenosylmethionine:tRNA ribosyltransferase-isomerase
VKVVALTHAAGLSATGDPAIDAALPLPERYDIPAATIDAVRQATRVVAIGTSVVRALESAARGGFPAGEGITDLKIGPETRRRVVDAILTGTHEIETSHFDLLRAFASRPALEQALADSEEAGLLGHELGDLWLIWGEPVDRAERAGETRGGAAVPPDSEVRPRRRSHVDSPPRSVWDARYPGVLDGWSTCGRPSTR